MKNFELRIANFEFKEKDFSRGFTRMNADLKENKGSEDNSERVMLSKA